MKNQYRSWMMLAVTGLVCTSFAEPFTLKEADHKQLLERGILEWDMSSSGLQSVTPTFKVPEGVIEPKIKLLFSGRGPAPMLLLFKSSKESKLFDRAILDEAGKRDFTDDPVLILDPEKPVAVTWKHKSGEPVDYSLYLVKTRQYAQGNVALLPKLWREGTLALDGKPVRALLQNSGMQKSIILDRDGDGKFNFNSPGDQFPLSTFVLIKDSFYKTVQGSSEEDWSLEPYKGPFGKLELSGEMVPPGSQGEALLVLIEAGSSQNKSRPNSFTIKTALTNQPIVIPVGEYMVRQGTIPDSNPKSPPVSFRMDNKLVISPDQVTKLVLNKPKMDITVTQKARTLTVRRVVGSTGTPGITYSVGRDKEPLVVDVVDPSDPAKVLIGRKNMEYG